MMSYVAYDMIEYTMSLDAHNEKGRMINIPDKEIISTVSVHKYDYGLAAL